MEVGIDLAALRQTVGLLHREIMLEGWAAYRVNASNWRAGLLLLSSWRVMFVDGAGDFSAMPIANLECVEIVSPTQVMISTWYDRLNVGFDNPSAPAMVLNRLQQDRNWNALVLGQDGKAEAPPRVETPVEGGGRIPMVGARANAYEH